MLGVHGHFARYADPAHSSEDGGGLRLHVLPETLQIQSW